MIKRIGVLTAFVVLAFPALAGARIVVNQSIAGINLGVSKAYVLKHFGPPAQKKVVSGQTLWSYFGRKLVVGVRNGRVTEVFTQNPGQKTASGIGVGSSIAAVKSHIKGVRCQHVPNFMGQECITVAKHGANEWTSDFHVDNGKVSSVLVNILSGVGGALDHALQIHL